jgi:hypothetical protein
MFPIRCARGTRDGSIYAYGLAEQEDGTGWSLVFSYDESTCEGYSLSTTDGATWYDALQGWSLDGQVLRLVLTREAAAELSLPIDLRLQLDTESVDAAEVRDAMNYFAKPS